MPPLFCVLEGIVFQLFHVLLYVCPRERLQVDNIQKIYSDQENCHMISCWEAHIEIKIYICFKVFNQRLI